MSSSDQPPVPGRTIILQQKRNGHAIVVRENNTITHEMGVGDEKRFNRTSYAKGQRFSNHFGEDFVYTNDHKANEYIRIMSPYGSVP
jgi:hypothetical protein